VPAMVTKPPQLATGESPTAGWPIFLALAAGVIFLVIGLTTMAARLGPEYGVLGIIALAAGLGCLVLAASDRDVLPLLLLLSLLPSLRLILSDVLTIYAFDPVLALMYLAWIWDIRAGRIERPRISLVDLLWLAWIGWLFASALLSAYVPPALGHWTLWLRAFLIYFYAAHRLNRRSIWMLAGALSLIIVLENGLGLLQFWTRTNIGAISDMVGRSVNEARQVALSSGGQLFRVRGTLGSDTALAHWLELILPLQLSLLLVADSPRRRLWLLIVIASGVTALILTFTRGGWVGLVVGVGAVLLFSIRKILRYPKLLTVVAGALLLMMLGAVPFAGLIRGRLLESATDTVSVRFNLNRVAVQVIRDHPLFGIGLGNFPRVAPDYGVGYTWLVEGAEHKVHNLYLALAVEGGMPALLWFLLFLILALVTAGVAGRLEEGRMGALTQGVLAGHVAVLIHGLVAWGLISYMVFPFWALMFGLLVASTRMCITTLAR